MITHELAEEEEEYLSSEVNCQNLLNIFLIEGDNKSIKDDNSLNLVKVIDSFMGLKSQEN